MINIHKVQQNKNRAILLLAIVIITLGTRLYHLNYQSLWFDELYSVTVASPENTFRDILTDIKTDFHPPFYYFFLNVLFKIVPYNDLSARLISVIIGCFSIWLIYLLGRRIRGNTNDGQTYGAWLALFFSAFFFHIRYSQEARMYIFLFTLSIVTTLLILNYFEKKEKKYLIFYLLSCLTLIYTHYFGFFILFGHALWALHLFVATRNDKTLPTRVDETWPTGIDKTSMINLILTYFVLFLLYLPWMPMIFQTGGREHFMESPPPWYLFEFIYEYAGKEPVTSLFILTGLVLYLIAGVRKIRNKSFSQSPFQLLVLYVFISVFIVSFLISFYKPLINKQSTMAGLPFLIMLVFTGFKSVRSNTLYKIVTLVVVSSLMNLAFINRYYKDHHKENFRQIVDKTCSLYNSENIGDYEGIHDNEYNTFNEEFADAYNAEHKSENSTVVISQVSKFYNYYFEQKKSNLRAQNPNIFHPKDISEKTQLIIVLNAPYTVEKEQKLESMDELGFEIMNPRLLHKIDSTDIYQKEWNDFIAAGFELTHVIYNPFKGTEVGFVHMRKVL